ncbi:hypothetical protein [Fischerella thermalis]|uniref:hypothetical protein n=1 Tax=Fischerella thermalis TaxID=372787 RepID=UPI0011AF6CBB|nr:hypothetical protein [Fischerella thermalis]
MTKKYKLPAIAPFCNWVQLNTARVVPLARGGKTADSLQWRLCCQDKTGELKCRFGNSSTD